MLFSSITFLYLFLPAVLFGYYVLFRKNRFLQNLFLLIVSLIFYAWGEPVFVLIMIASILMNWLAGMLVNFYRGRRRIPGMIVAFSVVFNLGILFIFKYLNFFNRILREPFSIPAIALPIGISFFTFQALSYVIDVYRGKGEVQKNPLYVGLYISFFPQLIAGPIVRYETIAQEILSRKETLDDFLDGFGRFTVGLGKKVLLANSFAVLADAAFNTAGNMSVAFSWLGAVGYTFQIYYDFSGYSDMAIGLGRMFGFHFLENFRYPYLSCSVSEFWRRWHISLGTWFRDYVYIPLGGSRKGNTRTIWNLFVVWALTGLWHGANVTFVCWGLMFFVLILIEKLTGFEKTGRGKYGFFKWIYTMLFVVLGWVLFRSDRIQSAWIYLKSMAGMNGNPLTDGMFTGYFRQNAVLLAAGILASTPCLKRLAEKQESFCWIRYLKTAWLILLLVLSVASLVSSAYNPFIYFNF
ncbi:MAG: MBOAT family protein [Clostridiales bacterium]|nr:MBOAT family protein [Clostridiales bacterium]